MATRLAPFMTPSNFGTLSRALYKPFYFSAGISKLCISLLGDCTVFVHHARPTSLCFLDTFPLNYSTRNVYRP